MKTIYKQPKNTKPKTNGVQAIKPLNTTGTLKRVECTRYDLIVSYATPIAYVVDVENGSFINETKVILCNYYYSTTTRKHQAKVREFAEITGAAIGEFDLGGFYKRAEIDGVYVKGGSNR